MELVKIIREHFATLKRKGSRKIEYENINAWTFVNFEGAMQGYGVFIENTNDVEILEDFANVTVTDAVIQMEGKSFPILMLITNLDQSQSEFSSLCAQFVELGKNYENRNLLQSDPHEWVRKWRDLLGNRVASRTIYDVLSELLVVEYLTRKKVEHVWKGPKMATWDVEGKDFVADVKSTSLKYDNIIQISSQYQLDSEYPLYIFFCRVEESVTGESINSVIERLDTLGCNMEVLESNLSKMGYEKRRNERDIRFNILEKRIYEVNENFPKISMASFVGGNLPLGVVKVTYSVDLSGIIYDEW